jgi:alpha-tubulin suppressor-like RCC1 family protein
MSYKTYWLSGILAAMTLFGSAQASNEKVAASRQHTVFIDNGAVFAMGQNNYRQVDFSIPATSSTPALATNEKILNPKYLGIQNAKSAAASNNRSAVLKNDGSILMWGQMTSTTYTAPYNVLPSGVIATDLAMTNTDLFYVANGDVFKWNYISSPVRINNPLDGKVTTISAGEKHLIALYANGSVATFGLNAFGQLGNGTTTANTALTILPGIQAVEVLAAGESSYIRTNAAIMAFGKNTSYQLGFADGIHRYVPTVIPSFFGVKKMTGTFNAALMLMNDNSVAAAGFHNYIGGTNYNLSKVFTLLDGLTGIAQVHSGGQQIFVSKGEVGVLRGWGGNSAGQLGDSTMVERHNPSYAYFTPVAAPVMAQAVVAAPVATPAVVAEPTQTGSVFTNPFAPVAPVPVAPIAVVQYTSMNACLAALGPVKGGLECKNLIVDPAQRGNGH